MKVRPTSAAVLLVLGVALTVGGLTRAGDEVNPRTGSRSPNEITQKRVTMRLQNLAAKLELNEDQKSALRPILESEANALRAVRMNTSITPEEQQTELASIQDNYREQIRTVLTPSQWTKLEELRSEARAKLVEPAGQKRKGRVPVMPDND